MNQKGLGTFRLPTEAEWEYACQAGTATRFYWGDDPDYSQSEQYAWHRSNSVMINEVGLKKSNAWGLFDMSGNALEWCQDWYDTDPSGAQTDPQGPIEGIRCIQKVLRGGNGYQIPWYCRSSCRGGIDPDIGMINLGLRVVMTP